MELIVLSSSDEELRSLGLHLFLDGVSSLIVKEAVAVAVPSDALHYAVVVVNI